MWLKAVSTWIETKWNAMEAWTDTWLPGAKTKIVAGMGVVGSAAASLQDYIQQVPYIGQYLSTSNMAIASVVLFTLAFWFRGLSDRVAKRNA